MSTNHSNCTHFESSSVLLPQIIVNSPIAQNENISSVLGYRIKDLEKVSNITLNERKCISSCDVKDDAVLGIVEQENDPMDSVNVKASAFDTPGQFYDDCRVNSIVIGDRDDNSKHFRALLNMQDDKLNLYQHHVIQLRHDGQDERGSPINVNSNDGVVDMPVGMDYDDQFMFQDLFVLGNQKQKKGGSKKARFVNSYLGDSVGYATPNGQQPVQDNGKVKRRSTGQRQRIYEQGANDKSDVQHGLPMPHLAPIVDFSKYPTNNEQQTPSLDYVEIARTSPVMGNGNIYEPTLDIKPSQSQDMHHIYNIMPVLLPAEGMNRNLQLDINPDNEILSSPANHSYCDTAGNSTISDIKNANNTAIIPSFPETVNNSNQMVDVTQNPYYRPPVNLVPVNPLKRRRFKSKRHSKKRDSSGIDNISSHMVEYRPEVGQIPYYPHVPSNRTQQDDIVDIKDYIQDPKNALAGYPDACAPTPQLKKLVEQMKIFLVTAPIHWTPDQKLKRFYINNDESISCILWNNYFYITGTDIVRSLKYRFCAFGRPVKNMKKFEEGIFSDLRNLKPGFESTLESSHSEFLRYLYKGSCIKTQKKQKVFHWFSVPHDRLFMDALERDFKREALGIEPTSTSLVQMPLSKALDKAREECLVMVASYDIFCGTKNYSPLPLMVPGTNKTNPVRQSPSRINRIQSNNDDEQDQRCSKHNIKKSDDEITQQKYWNWEGM